MRFSAEGRVTGAGVDKVYEIVRDKLPDLVPFLDNVSMIKELEREERPTGPRILNRWRADAGQAPAIARKFLKPEMLEWLDHADWVDAETLVHWRIESAVFKGMYTCSGTNSVVADPAGARIVISGELHVDPKSIPGLPRLLARKILPTIEHYLIERMKPNMASLGTGVQRWLVAGQSS